MVLLNIMPLLLTWLLFLYNFAPYWMYIVWICCWSILGGLVKLYYCNKLCGLSYKDFFNEVFFPCLIITILTFSIGTVVSNLLDEGLIRLFFVCISTSFMFLLTGWRIVLTQEEKVLILKIINKIKLKK